MCHTYRNSTQLSQSCHFNFRSLMSIQSWLCSNLQLDLPLRTYIWTIYADCRSKMRGLSFFLVILSVYNIYIHLTSWSIMHNSRKKLVAPRSMLWSILLLPLTLIYTPNEMKLSFATLLITQVEYIHERFPEKRKTIS